MKKILTLLLLASSINLFGYFASDNMIDMLVHSNQLRIRTDRFGALFGNRNVRAAIGLTAANNFSGIILNNLGKEGESLADNYKGIDKFIPSLLGAIGYDSDIFGIAAGYEFTWKAPTYMVHTPILHMTALDDNFRINIPVSIGVGQDSAYNKDKSLRGTMVISTAIEARYYFNQPYFSHIRLFFNYGNATIKEIHDPNINFTQQSIGFQARAYFRYELPYNMVLEPIIRVQFDTALATRYNNIDNKTRIEDNYFITAKGFIPNALGGTGSFVGAGGANADLSTGNLSGGYLGSIPEGYFAKNPYRVGIALPLGMRATSETGLVEFYLEPALSLSIVNAKEIFIRGTENLPAEQQRKRYSPFYTFGYVVYGELYIRPIPQLEWYLELQTGGSTIAGDLAGGNNTSLIINGATGITWYF